MNEAQLVFGKMEGEDQTSVADSGSFPQQSAREGRRCHKKGSTKHKADTSEGFECVARRIGRPGVFKTNPKQWVESEGRVLFEACRAFRR